MRIDLITSTDRQRYILLPTGFAAEVCSYCVHEIHEIGWLHEMSPIDDRLLMKIHRARNRSGQGESITTAPLPYANETAVYAGRSFRYGDVLTLNQSHATYAHPAQPLWDTGGPRRHEPFSHKVQAKALAEARDLRSAKRVSPTVRVLHRTAAFDPYVALAVTVLERVLSLAERRGVQPAHQTLDSDAAEIDTWLRAAAEALIERGASSSDPLQAARDRGRLQALAELQKPDNLTLRDASIYSGRSDGAINEARLKGRLYALVPPGKQRGLRYPQWQFDAEPERLAAVLAPFVQASASCWVVHSFMRNALESLGGASPMAWILDASKPIDPVVEAARTRYDADQGAA